MIEDITLNTICAPATGSESGAISIIRVSGPKAIQIVSDIVVTSDGRTISEAKGYSVRYGCIYNDGQLIDEVLVAVFRAPHSYTGEDSCEISCHGSQYIVGEIIALLIDKGCTLAGAGEFTKRAFLNGKMDLAQAEAVADVIASETAASHRLAIAQMRGGFSNQLATMRGELLKIVSLMELELDFSEEEVKFADRGELNTLMQNTMDHISRLVSSFRLGNAIKNGVPVAIVGATNTGKSTLLNSLLGEERAIVSSIAGTTRDTIEDTINLDGILFRFIDTAGIRNTIETIELIGIERTYFKIKQASIVIMMLDANRADDFAFSLRNLASRVNETQTVIILLNKCEDINPDFLENQKRKKLQLTDDLSKIVTDITELCAECGLSPAAVVPISAKHNVGIDKLRSVLVSSKKQLKCPSGDLLVTNMRHYTALKDAYAALLAAHVALKEHVPTDLICQDIREAIYSLGTITGEISTDEILGSIFRNFCIGK